MDESESFWAVFCIGLKARIFNFKEFFKVLWCYWRDRGFAKIDFQLTSCYFFESPYHINSKLGLELYGETPLTTMDKIAKIAKICSKDVVYELGSGRGRIAFWLNHFYACKVCAIEYNPLFVNCAKALQEKQRIGGIEFIVGDMRERDFSEATCIYLYGTLLSDQDINQMIQRFKKLKPDVRIITISYPLTEYDSQTFQVVSEFDVDFPWGRTSAYLQEVRGSSTD